MYYMKRLGYFPHLVDCRDFNDKIQWLKLFDQDVEIIRCSDKLLVREYVKERVGEKYLTEVYQIRKSFDAINFETLPKSFVIKTNHDSGSVALVRDKLKMDYKQLQKRFTYSLKRLYGWENGEWAYAFIQPKVFVEELINPDSNQPPADYKFYCIDGKVKFMHYIYDRHSEPKEQIVDRHGNDLNTELFPTFKLGKDFKKPADWEEMISIAEKLGTGFKCVRIDMFNANGRIIVGEMTFWPQAGCYRGAGQKKLGKYLDFDRTTYKAPVYHKMKKS